MKYSIRNIFSSCIGLLFLVYLIHHLYFVQKPDTLISPYPTLAQIQVKLQFQETIFDFGKIKAGAIIKHVYVLINTGTQPAVIQEVIPSCKLCIQAFCEPRFVHPNGQASIIVEFNSTGRAGKQAKYVTIRSNATSSPDRVLIKGEVTD